jgi:hypothetical protein
MRLAFNAHLCKAGNKRRILVRNDYRSLLRTEYSITALQRGYILMVGRFSVGERPKRVFVVNQPPYPLSALARASIPSGLISDVAIDARLAPPTAGYSDNLLQQDYIRTQGRNEGLALFSSSRVWLSIFAR